MPRLIVFILLLALTACATPTQPTASPAPSPAQAAQAPATPRPEPTAAPEPTAVPTPSRGDQPSHPPQPTPQPGELAIAVCDPANGPFTLTIDNPFLPLPVGMIQVLENPTTRVQLSVLNETETVAGVTTRVVEEREWAAGQLTEVSRNFFVQAPDGTVCYYGEDVDDYADGQIVGHAGAWRTGVGENKPGIMMPAQPVVGQTYYQEVAPGVAEDRAEHVAIGESYTTPAGSFSDVVLVQETPPSTKRYARGIGLIFDDGMVLTTAE